MEEYKYEEQFYQDRYGNPGNVRPVPEPRVQLIRKPTDSLLEVLFMKNNFKKNMIDTLAMYGEYMNRIHC